jgi:PIN domain nuclease of toxin-antitoxin system
MGGQGSYRRRVRRADARNRGAVRELRILLDTHVALWWANDPAKLTDSARSLIADGGNDVFLSAASVWEAAIKTAAGRLVTPTPIDEAAPTAGLRELTINWTHCRRAAALPPLHRDPFDRMLVAQALEEGLVLVTRDPLVQQYAVPTAPG